MDAMNSKTVETASSSSEPMEVVATASNVEINQLRRG